jgi:oligopeptide/dipeptide ABC transporter ATP-binding protein
MSEPLLLVHGLVVEYGSPRGASLRAVDGVSFQINRGEILALVGESGCGKSTVGLTLVGLVPPRSGEIAFAGSALPTTGRGWKRLRRRVSFIFQDPYASLDPMWRIASIIAEPLRIHRGPPADRPEPRVRELAALVGLEEALLPRRPGELSGGQRQRVAIARALATEPELIVADEPTAALDVSVRAQVLNLIKELQVRLGLALLFISHDLATVRYLADRVAVMYAATLVETGPTGEVLREPLHPYTAALVRSLPEVGAFGVLPPVLEGEVPDPRALPGGCRFHTRCPRARSICQVEEPKLQSVGNREFACHFPLVGVGNGEAPR